MITHQVAGAVGMITFTAGAAVNGHNYGTRMRHWALADPKRLPVV